MDCPRLNEAAVSCSANRIAPNLNSQFSKNDAFLIFSPGRMKGVLLSNDRQSGPFLSDEA